MLSKEELEYRIALWNRVQNRLRIFFVERGYLEVHTPIVVRSPGMEPNLDPVAIELKDVAGEGMRAGLITSPEYAMKKLLGAGLERIFTITPVFRNCEENGGTHATEFTMLEWYRQKADYLACIEETKLLIDTVLKGTVAGEMEGVVNGAVDGVVDGAVDGEEDGGKIGDCWFTISYVAEFKNRFGGQPDAMSLSELAGLAEGAGIVFGGDTRADELVDLLFNAVLLPDLVNHHPKLVIKEYPVSGAALAKRSVDGLFAERFEIYVKGLEICNGFTELTDSTEQRRRFEEEGELRRELKKTVYPIDEELLSGLDSISDPTYGNALGVDRLVMLVAGTKEIDAIAVFPPSQRYKFSKL